MAVGAVALFLRLTRNDSDGLDALTTVAEKRPDT